MKKYIALLAFGTLILSSCQKVIDLKLNTTAAEIVIQGTVYDQPGPFTVTISKTVNFDQSNLYPPVSDAIVSISDNLGITDTLKEISSGTYQTSKITGVPGTTYTLTVNIGDTVYMASSTMPSPIDIDSVYVEKAIFGDGKQVSVMFQDPPNIVNYYRLVEFINNVQQPEFYSMSDKNFDGNMITYSMRSTGDNDIKVQSGDSITIWLECIDKGAYEFFRTAGSQSWQSASPANPISNISNGALGFFSACSVRKKSIFYSE